MSNPGIYIHLPYCVSRCSYCAFVVSTDPASRSRYLQALGREMELVRAQTRDALFDSVYLGGGTPSVIPPEDFAALLKRIQSEFRIAEDSEVTAEANPEDVTEGLLDSWKRAGVNRVSLGVQALEDAVLRAAGRRHDAMAARRARDLALAAEVSVSCDLILGLPDQSAAAFLSDVSEMAQSGVTHLSIYLLELDKAPRLAQERSRKPERYLGDDEEAQCYLAAGEILRREGFEHYEISNWARSGARARHNMKYWCRIPTLGLGVGAHEFWDDRRRANSDSLGNYLAAIEEGRRPTVLDAAIAGRDGLQEEILLAARTTDGVLASSLSAWMLNWADADLPGDWRDWVARGLIREEKDRFIFTEEGFLLSSEVLCRFA